jgi:hypothetical protein
VAPTTTVAPTPTVAPTTTVTTDDPVFNINEYIDIEDEGELDDTATAMAITTVTTDDEFIDIEDEEELDDRPNWIPFEPHFGEHDPITQLDGVSMVTFCNDENNLDFDKMNKHFDDVKGNMGSNWNTVLKFWNETIGNRHSISENTRKCFEYWEQHHLLPRSLLGSDLEENLMSLIPGK